MIDLDNWAKSYFWHCSTSLFWELTQTGGVTIQSNEVTSNRETGKIERVDNFKIVKKCVKWFETVLKKEFFAAGSKVMMIMGDHFTFHDGSSHTAFLRQLQLSFISHCVQIPGSRKCF